MKVKVTHLGNVRFAVETRGHTILCDQPVENGGDDSAMTPPELLLASLGTCAEFYAVQYLKARNLDAAGIVVTVSAEKLKQPPRLGDFRIQVTYATALKVEQVEGLERAVHHCLIHNTLLSLPEMQIELVLAEPVLQ